MTHNQSSKAGSQPGTRPRTSDDLEKCIRVTPPSVWVVLAAFALFLMGLLGWGFFGTIATRITATGTLAKGGVICFLSEEDVAKVHMGDEAGIKGARFEVASCSDSPISRGEVEDMLTGSHSDYLAKVLVDDDWSYMVQLTGDTSTLKEGVPLPMEITIERIAPIELILGSAE